jgi:hypothetical protein
VNHEEISDLTELQATLFSKAPEIDKILVLCTFKNEAPLSIDNGLTVAEANLLVCQFQHWLMDCLAKPVRVRDEDEE